MKRLFVVAPVACLVAAAAVTAAHAEELSWLQSVSMYKFYGTLVEGTVKVPPTSGPLAGFACSDVIVDAHSQAATTGPFPVSKWVRSTHAAGTYSSGSCHYAMPVPASQAFTLTVEGSGKFNCSTIQGGAGPSPFTSVKSGTTATVNLDAVGFLCINYE